MKQFRILYVFFVLLVGLYVVTVAQAPIASILTAAHAAAQKYPDAYAVYLESEDTVQLDPDGTYHETLHRASLLLDQTGIDTYGVAHVLYGAPDQEIRLDYARTIAPDGRVAMPDKTAIHDEPSIESDYSPEELAQAQPFSHYQIEMPDVQTGSVVDWQVTVTGKYPLLPGKFAAVRYLATQIPTVELRYEVKVPRSTPFRWAVTKTDLQPEIQTKSDTVIYTFRSHDISGIPKDEPGMLDISTLSPAVIVSTIETWDDVAGALAREFDRSTQPDQAIISKAKELTLVYTSRKVKIDRIYKFVANQILSSSGFHVYPFPADATLLVGRGDCKDQAALLIALLKAAGIDAYPVFLNAYVGTDVDFGLPPAFGLFNHVIVAVPEDGGWRFLDPILGAGYLPQYLPARDTDKHAMLLLAKPDLPWVEVVTPQSSAEANEIKTSAEMNVYKDGSITLQARSMLTGEEVAALKTFSDYYSEDDIRNYYQRTVAKVLPGAKIASLSAYDLFDPYAVPLTFTATIRADGAVDTTKDSFALTVPYPPPISAFTSALPDLDPASRTYPYFTTPERIEISTHIRIPRGWKAVLPAGVHVENEIGNFRSYYHEEGSTGPMFTEYSCDRVLQINLREIPPEKIVLLKDIFDALAQDEWAKIAVHKETASDQ